MQRGRNGADVLHVVTDTDRRGAQVFGYELGEQLAMTGTPVRTVALTAGAQGGLPFEVLGPSRLHPATLRALREQMGRSSVTVGFGSTTLPACTLAGRRPFVYRSIGEIGRWAVSRTQRTWVRAALARASAIVALWEGAADDLHRGFGVRRSKIHVIPRGVASDRFPVATADDRRAARVALGLTNEPVVVAIGALATEKRLDVAIETVALLPGVHLVLAGAGPLEDELRASAERLAPGRIHFSGHVDDVVPVLHAADTLLLTSATEGMPGVVIEAGMSGVPTVATDVGAVSEMVVEGETGRVVDRDAPAARIAVALDATLSEASRLADAARQHCLQHYELATVGASWASMLDRVRERQV
jgi:glycosyltransferase involved in cell wall biosynthesis